MTSETTIHEAISRIAEYARGQGAGRFESAAYTAACEHFERHATPPSGVRYILGIASYCLGNYATLFDLKKDKAIQTEDDWHEVTIDQTAFSCATFLFYPSPVM
jgi:hypothetical protein